VIILCALCSSFESEGAGNPTLVLFVMHYSLYEYISYCKLWTVIRMKMIFSNVNKYCVSYTEELGSFDALSTKLGCIGFQTYQRLQFSC
jgi:hypothetical protein